MTDIGVSCVRSGDAWSCAVVLRDLDASATRHEVRVTSTDLARLAPGVLEPKGLVERSFAFLLAREPKESILREFDLSLIGRYFPDYEVEITKPI